MNLRIAVVGVGFMGQLHARAVSESDVASLAAVVDLDGARGTAVAGQLGTRYRPTVESALEDEDIDAFVVALPDRLHLEVTSLLLGSGRPVLLEKPLADDLDSAQQIVAAAREGGGRLMVGHILRFDPRYVQAAQAVASGAIGEPLHSMAGRIATRSIGTRLRGSSSVLFYLGVHDADAIQWVTGKRIVGVYARTVSKLMPSLGVQSEDAILSVVDFEDGSIGQLFNGWTRRDDSPIEIDGRLEVFGADGVVEVDVRDHGLNVFGPRGFSLPDGMHWPDINGRLTGDLAVEISHFARAVVQGTPFLVPVEDALRAVAVNDAILRSLASRRPEVVEDVSGSVSD
jgi:predicted dehydrogenase